MMMPKKTITGYTVIFFVAFILACGNSISNKVNKELPVTFNAFLENYYTTRLHLYPLEATLAGDTLYNHVLLNDGSEKYRKQQHLFVQSYLDTLLSYDREPLSENDKISFDVLKEQLELNVEKEKFHTEYIPFNNIIGLPHTLAQWAAGDGSQPFNNAKDYQNWLQRLEVFPSWADTAINNFRKGIAAKTVLPQSLVKVIIPKLKNIISYPAESSVFFKMVLQMPAEINKNDRAAVSDAYRNMIESKINPAYERLVRFFENEYLPLATVTEGCSSLPNGKQYYQLCIREFTTTNKTPEEIYSLGLSEVERITKLLENAKTATGFKGTLTSFFKFINTHPQFKPFKTTDDVLNAYRAVEKTIEPALKNYFTYFPKGKLKITAAPDFQQGQGSPGYTAGTADGSRPGIFSVPINRPEDYNVTFGIEAVFLHEAIPGHHLQGSIQTENKNLPSFRRNSVNSAYEEGWALYCESMGKELGLYKDPYQYVAALGKEMHRAIRLVLDVAIHTNKMNKQQAIAYMMQHEPVEIAFATSEVERYMAWPGQALSYKIGAVKMVELKDKYKKMLGEKFSIALFHDALLADGGMPLNILEAKLDRWANEINQNNQTINHDKRAN